MRRHLTFLFSLLLCLSSAAQSVGLVLSGGGAKGLTHIGIIHALEDNDIPIDYIAGSSIGAVIGSLYAIGYTPEEMLDFITSDEFRRCYTGNIDEEDIYFLHHNDPTPAILNLYSSLADSLHFSPSLPTSLTDPTYMNICMPDIFARATAACHSSFDSLFVPFACIASDVYHKRSILFRSGDLGSAVRASMTFPFVFKPIDVGGQLLYDGGIYNNFPADVLKDQFHPDFTIGSVVTQNSAPPAEDDIIGQVEAMIMRQTDYSLSDSAGILLSFDLADEVSLLDFSQARRLHDLGYNAVLQVIDSIRSNVHRTRSVGELNMRRIFFRQSWPELRFRHISIQGASPLQQQYITNEILSSSTDGTFTMADLRAAYFRLLSDDAISEILPTAVWNEADGTFDLHLLVTMQDKLFLSLGGALSTGDINQIYFSACYNHIGRQATQYLLEGQTGRAYRNAAFSTRISFPHSFPFTLHFTSAWSQYDYFYQSTRTSTLLQTPGRDDEIFARLHIELPFLTQQKARFSIGAARIATTCLPSGATTLKSPLAHTTTSHMLGSSLWFGCNTLDSPCHPTAGRERHLLAQVFTSNEIYTPPTNANTPSTQTRQSWMQLSWRYQKYHPIVGSFAVGTWAEAFYTSRDNAPTFALTAMQTPAFAPTPSMSFMCNPAFRQKASASLGLMPLLRLSSIVHLRAEGFFYLPLHATIESTTGAAQSATLLSQAAHIEELTIAAKYTTLAASATLHYDSTPYGGLQASITIGWQIPGKRFIER